MSTRLGNNCTGLSSYCTPRWTCSLAGCRGSGSRPSVGPHPDAIACTPTTRAESTARAVLAVPVPLSPFVCVPHSRSLFIALALLTVSHSFPQNRPLLHMHPICTRVTWSTLSTTKYQGTWTWGVRTYRKRDLPTRQRQCSEANCMGHPQDPEKDLPDAVQLEKISWLQSDSWLVDRQMSSHAEARCIHREWRRRKGRTGSMHMCAMSVCTSMRGLMDGINVCSPGLCDDFDDPTGRCESERLPQHNNSARSLPMLNFLIMCRNA